MKFSNFASRFNDSSGIVQLMDDLGNAMNNDSDLLMLGGGNPVSYTHLTLPTICSV